ncbi:hypothetical protein ABZX95_46405 [Streptomyces sp. NPDC004232]|uniref:hypothetical protein n=1 Tax=Streptomyces sp. NPDC004232 TaxID=3154454 RepID=UPI001DE8488E|nr:hypothetical protein [Streptomyces sp. tea 10]
MFAHSIDLLAASLRRLGNDLGTLPPDNGALLAHAMAAAGPQDTAPAVDPVASLPYDPAHPIPAEPSELRTVLDVLVGLPAPPCTLSWCGPPRHR